MRTRKFFYTVTILIISVITGFGNNENDETIKDFTGNNREVQIGIYVGYAFDQNISNVHGSHWFYWEGETDVSVEGVVIEQDLTIGLSARYYISEYFGIDFDAMYSPAEFPEQQIKLGGYTIYQPKSDLDFFTFSIGPNLRYTGDGLWEKLNPFARIAFSLLFGNINNVNLYPVYSEGGSSTLSGYGFNISLGPQYRLTKIIVSLEYRFEFLDIDVDHFRSFTKGFSLNKRGSYLLLGINYNF